MKMDLSIERLTADAIELTSYIPGGRLPDECGIIEIAHGGSDRHFFRLSDGGRSVVALIQPGGGDEFERYLSIGSFLAGRGIAVPIFYHADRDLGILIMEDLGSVHLEDHLRDASPEEELSFYRDCIEVLAKFQTTVTSGLEEMPRIKGHLFGLEKLLGETAYFEREFIGRYSPVDIPDGWDRDRKVLAETLASQPQVFMHRDYQSRNILVKEGSIRIIDFQTAHLGPGLYDVASLLKDPYHPLCHGTRRSLLMELYYRLGESGLAVAGGFEQYYVIFLLAGIQRNLQALAAFAFLGLAKGKKEFLRYIPSAMDLLEEGVDEADNLPAVRELVTRIRSMMP